MKKIIIIALVAITSISAFDSCKKKSTNTGSTTTSTKYIDVEVPYTKTKLLDQAIPALPVSLPVELTDSFATQTDLMLATYAPGVSKDKVQKINAVSFNIQIDNASSSQTLDFIDDSVKVYVDAYGGTNPILVATKYNIPAGATSINFDVLNTDLKALFYNEYMQTTIKFNSKPNQGMAANTNFITNLKFHINAIAP